jgi:hypothetical protein
MLALICLSPFVVILLLGLLFDDDDAGRKLAKFGDYVEVVPEGKDLGDAPDDI